MPLPIASSAETVHSGAFIQMEQRGEVIWIILNRTPWRNSFNFLAIHLLEKAVQAAIENPLVRGLVITGKGGNFSTGADLTFFQRHVIARTLEPIEHFSAALHTVFQQIANSPKPVVAAIRGAALGAGLELALACHYRIVTRGATLALPETGLGICPGAGGTQRLPRQIGLGLAKWLIYTGHLLAGSKAPALGLANQTVTETELESTAQNWAERGTLPNDALTLATPLSEEHQAISTFFSSQSVAQLLGKASNPSSQLEPRAARLLHQLVARPRSALELAEQLIDAGSSLPLAEALQLEVAAQRTMFASEAALLGLTKIR